MNLSHHQDVRQFVSSIQIGAISQRPLSKVNFELILSPIQLYYAEVALFASVKVGFFRRGVIRVLRTLVVMLGSDYSAVEVKTDER